MGANEVMGIDLGAVWEKRRHTYLSLNVLLVGF